MLRKDMIAECLDDHVGWLRGFDALRVKKFGELRRSNWESAACEAIVGRYLRDHVRHVEPAEHVSTGGPDFRCEHDGHTFYVETTCLSIKAVEKASWVPDDPKWKGGSVGCISAIVQRAVCGKVRQCHRTDAPTLVALGTHHTWMSMGVDKSLVRDLLISDESYVVPVSPSNPIPNRPGQFVTGLRNALFMEADVDGVVLRRQPVAGVLVFGLGVSPPHVIGVLNDQPRRPFDVRLLPEVQFAKTVVEDHHVVITWSS